MSVDTTTMKNAVRVYAIIEARMTSTRLPGKVLLEAVGKPMLELMVERLRRSPTLNGIIIATTENQTDDPIAHLTSRLGIDCHRGSEEDVLQRVLDAARAYQVDVIVEIPGDCPLIDSAYVDVCVEDYCSGNADYVSSALSESFPKGTEVQVFATETLADVAKRTNNRKDREHVSLFMYRNPDLYQIRSVAAPLDIARPEVHLTLDEQADFEFIRTIFEALYPEKSDFSLVDVLTYLDTRPELLQMNRNVSRTVV